MKIDMLGLQAFVAISDLQGFGKAAASLHITQTALTRRLQNLEASAPISGCKRGVAVVGGYERSP